MKQNNLEILIGTGLLTLGVIEAIASFRGIYYFGDNLHHLERFSMTKTMLCAGSYLFSVVPLGRGYIRLRDSILK